MKATTNKNKTNIKKTYKSNNTDNQIIYNTDIEENITNQTEKIQTNTKRQVNKHLTNNANVTQRKKQKNTHHSNNSEQIWIDNLPPPVTEENFPQLDNTTKQQKQKQKGDEKQQPTTTQQSQNITIIQETPISQQPQHEEEEIQFLSLAVITKPNQPTPDPIDSSKPKINENKIKQTKHNEVLSLTIYKKGKIVKQETIHNVGLKMTQKLAKLNYRDTGFVSNATTDEKQQIIALSLYYELGKFDPSNQFIRTYKDKTIINMVRQYTEQKLHKMDALTIIYMNIHAIEEQMEQNKNKAKN